MTSFPTLTGRLETHINTNCLRVPDLSFYTAEQIKAMNHLEKQSTRFAIEILPESESFQDVSDKIQDYFNGGTKLVWYIEPLK